MCSVYLSLLTKGKRIKYAIWDKRVLCAKRKTASKHVFVFMLVIICIVWNVFSRYTTSISSEQIMLDANNYLLEKLSSLHYRIVGCSVAAYIFTKFNKHRTWYWTTRILILVYLIVSYYTSHGKLIFMLIKKHCKESCLIEQTDFRFKFLMRENALSVKGNLVRRKYA